jgi:hypothetical protein
LIKSQVLYRLSYGLSGTTYGPPDAARSIFAHDSPDGAITPSLGGRFQ